MVYGIRQSPYLKPNRIVRLRLVGGDALVGTASCLGCLMMYSYSLRSLILLGLAWAAVLDGSEATAQLTEPPVRIEPAFAWSSARPSDALASASDAATYVGEELFPAPGLSPDYGQGSADRGDLGFANDPTYGLGPTAWQWTVLPDGLIYRSYMAGVKESRIAGVVYGMGKGESIFDATLGGRVGVLRLGTLDDENPEGWQVDLEGAAFPRLNLNEDWDVDATDFRIGVPLTYGEGPWRWKFGYYHLSSHLGDELIDRNPGLLATRINYSRDALILAASYFPSPAWRLYGEADWAFHVDEGNLPWEFQFGIDYAQPGRTGICGTPFAAVNGHIRESVDFGGNLSFQAGWLWRGDSGHTARFGLHYYNGKSSQYEFFDQHEQQIGVGIWYDQ